MADRRSVRFEGLMVTGVLFLGIVLALLSVNSLKLLSNTRDYLESEMEKRLANLADTVAGEIEGHYEDILRDPYYLDSISLRETLAGVTMLDQYGQVLASSRANTRRGAKYEPLGIPQQGLSDVFTGKTVVSPFYSVKGRRYRSVYFPVKDASGMVAAAGEATLNAGYIDDLTQLGTTYFFLKAIILVFIMLVLIYAMKTITSSQRRLVQAAKGAGAALDTRREEGDNVTFVVNTFQSMVASLKEKEKELKALKDVAEEKARRIESYNENVLRSIQSGVMTFGVDGKVITANQAAETMLGFGHGGAVGKAVDDVFGGGWVSGLIIRTLTENRPERRLEGGVRDGDGKLLWVGASASTLIGKDGRADGAILVFSDLTEVKELKDMMELRERMTVLGEMSAGIAHELRNPMGVISGYAELLAKRLSGDDTAMSSVRNIQSEIRIMDEIIREFMNFTQPTQLNLAVIDVGGLLDESLKSLSGVGDGVSRELNLADGLPDVFGDGVLLRQAFINIMKNALEATPQGGKLTVTATASSSIEEKEVVLPGKEYVRVDIADTGVGITKDALAKMFNPFFTTKSSGTGLGLALVQKILVYHGGRAFVNSQPGCGTVFSVYLPIMDEAAAPAGGSSRL